MASYSPAMSVLNTESPKTIDAITGDQRLQRGVAERDDLLCALVEILWDNEPGLKRVLLSMNNLLQDNLVFSSQLMYKLVVAATSGSKDEIPVRRSLLANALVCVQVLVRRIPAGEGALLLQQLLAKTSEDFQPYAAQILEHLFDDFVRLLGSECFLLLLDAMRKLLQSEKSKDRRSSYLLMTKIQLMCKIDGKDGKALLDSMQCSGEQWSVFLAIIADLEKQQLFESTFGTQLLQLQLMSSDLGERWLAWLRALCLRLLKIDENDYTRRYLKLRKVLDYFLAHLSVALLYRLGLLPEFLMATNKYQLFDPEDDNCLKEEQLKQFLAHGSAELLLQALVAPDFYSEPVCMLHWLRSMEYSQVKRVPKELFIRLCVRVRECSSCLLRKGIKDQVMLLFEATIDAFSLRDYMSCTESLFSGFDTWNDQERFIEKIEECTDFETHTDCFTKAFYEIFANSEYRHGFQPKVLNILKSAWKTLPKQNHGFWRLVLFDSNGDVFINFYRDVYNVDPKLLQKGASLEIMQVHLLDKLDCRSSEERSFLKSRCVDLFTRNLESWSQLEELNVNPMELLDQGTNVTSEYLGTLLGAHKKRLQDINVLSALIERSAIQYDCQLVLKYAYDNLTQMEVESCIADLLRYQKLSFWSYITQDTSLMLKLLIQGNPKKGNDRIVAACAHKLLNVCEYNAEVRTLVGWNIADSHENRSVIFTHLLKMNEQLSLKHPLYAINSTVHRRKIRIASALIQLLKYRCDPISLKGFLLPNDPLGLNLMHEFILGNGVKTIDWVLEALPKLQPREQESYLSVAHIYIVKHLRELEVQKLTEMLTVLIPFTKGPSYETRTLAQLILHNLAVKCEEKSIHNSLAVTLKSSVEVLLGDKLSELRSDPRLMLPEVKLDEHSVKNDSYGLLYITNAPFDEISLTDEAEFFNELYDNARQVFKARMLQSKGISLAAVEIARTSEKPAEQELILVASLVDKGTDIAELTRTCKKFGVRSLVLGEQSHSEESNSANLSIVEVKSASLTEFLVAKQAEGYEIVGSKAAFGILELSPFQFPRKCILVLGHEKLGIPANVIGVLDHIVGVPQIDPLDSNLGASLLVWAFFKQHCT